MSEADTDPFDAFLQEEVTTQNHDALIRAQVDAELTGMQDLLDVHGAFHLQHEGGDALRAAINELVGNGHTTEAAKAVVFQRAVEEIQLLKQVVRIRATEKLFPDVSIPLSDKKRVLARVQEADLGGGWMEAIGVALGDVILDPTDDEDVQVCLEVFEENMETSSNPLAKKIGAILFRGQGVDELQEIQPDRLLLAHTVEAIFQTAAFRQQKSADAEEYFYTLQRDGVIDEVQLDELKSLLAEHTQ